MLPPGIELATCWCTGQLSHTSRGLQSFLNSKGCPSSSSWATTKPPDLPSLLPLSSSFLAREALCSIKGDLCPIWVSSFQGHRPPLVCIEGCSYCTVEYSLPSINPRPRESAAAQLPHHNLIKKISAYLLAFHRSLSDNTELMEGSYES